MRLKHWIAEIIAELDEKNQRSQVLVLLSFLGTFAFIRIVTHLQRAGILPNQHGAVHIHHLVPGIILSLLSGYIGIAYWKYDRVRHVMAVIFGIGAALTIDEFALWLFLQDNYWSTQGRDSIDAVIITIALLVLALVLSEVNEHRLLRRLFHH